MGRPRTPTVVLETRGAYAKHPGRRRVGEPNTGRGIGEAPAYFTPDERTVWDELVCDTAPGLFQSSDRPVLEHLARLMAESRRVGERFSVGKLQVLVGICSRFGMTPSDRAKLSLAPSDDEAKPKQLSGLAAYRAAA